MFTHILLMEDRITNTLWEITQKICYTYNQNLIKSSCKLKNTCM